MSTSAMPLAQPKRRIDAGDWNDDVGVWQGQPGDRQDRL
jgi:hypothetical protein